MRIGRGNPPALRHQGGGATWKTQTPDERRAHNREYRERVNAMQKVYYKRRRCEHDWQEQPGEPPIDVCSRCGKVQR